MVFLYEWATSQDSDAIRSLIQSVRETIEQKDWFAFENDDFVSGILSSENSLVCKATEAETGELAGVFIADIPGTGPENLGRDIGLPEEELQYVAHMDVAAVLPQYRGNRIQHKLMQLAEAELVRRGYRYLMCTVHPDNAHSNSNVQEQGYRIVKTMPKYGGLPRNIYLKETNASRPS